MLCIGVIFVVVLDINILFVRYRDLCDRICLCILIFSFFVSLMMVLWVIFGSVEEVNGGVNSILFFILNRFLFVFLEI